MAKSTPTAICAKPGDLSLEINPAPYCQDDGITLIELLAALTISALVIVLIYSFIDLEQQTWNYVVSQSALNSAVATVEQKLLTEFQNVQTVTSISQNTVEGTLISSPNQSGALVTVTAHGDLNLENSDNSSTTLAFPDVSFSGTSFSLITNSSHQPVSVQVTLVARYIGHAAFSSASETLFIQYVLGGEIVLQ